MVEEEGWMVARVELVALEVAVVAVMEAAVTGEEVRVAVGVEVEVMVAAAMVAEAMVVAVRVAK